MAVKFTQKVDKEGNELGVQYWYDRYEGYLGRGEEQTHWLSMMNSFLIALFLAGLIA